MQRAHLAKQHCSISHMWSKSRDPTYRESIKEEKCNHLPLLHSEGWKRISKRHCIQQAFLYNIGEGTAIRYIIRLR